MRVKVFYPILIGALILAATSPAPAGSPWRTRAHIDVQTPGMVEAVVPPELISGSHRPGMDMTLQGPDQLPRAFELYWREPVGQFSQTLTPSKVRLEDDHDFIWEADIPGQMVLEHLKVEIADPDHVGKIDVQGDIQGEWKMLARNAAVFKTDGLLRADISVTPGPYERLRLRLRSFDRLSRNTLSPIKTVRAVGQRTGKDYHRQPVKLEFQQSRTGRRTMITSPLPGSGLWITSLQIKTRTPFQGSWTIGRQAITDGRKTFVPVHNGQIQYVGRQGLDLQIDRPWSGRSLIVELDTGRRHIGDILDVTATVRLPRIVFMAETAGRYVALGDSGEYMPILEHPGDRHRRADQLVTFSKPEANPHWRLASLVEKYQLKGGPFDPRGYTWQAPVAISQPGYYRLPLHPDAAHPAAVRIVKDGIQVPYIMGRIEDRTIELPVTQTYDPAKNTTLWEIPLPAAALSLRSLTIDAAGIFKRRIAFQIPKPGGRGWLPWKEDVWENRSAPDSAYGLSLDGLQGEKNAIRMIMRHGDNHPVEIRGITATYNIPTLYFLAYESGRYAIYGGHKTAPAPRYDLSLVQTELMAALPEEAKIGEIVFLKDIGYLDRIRDTFSDKGWGLYAIFGLVTLVLLVVIVRLFPKQDEPRA